MNKKARRRNWPGFFVGACGRLFVGADGSEEHAQMFARPLQHPEKGTHDDAYGQEWMVNHGVLQRSMLRGARYRRSGGMLGRGVQRSAVVRKNIAALATRPEQPMYRPPTRARQRFSVSKCSSAWLGLMFHDVYYVNKQVANIDLQAARVQITKVVTITTSKVVNGGSGMP